MNKKTKSDALSTSKIYNNKIDITNKKRFVFKDQLEYNFPDEEVSISGKRCSRNLLQLTNLMYKYISWPVDI